MSTTISCPTCAGPVQLEDTDVARCLVGHEVAMDELPRAVEAATSRALWAAVRALEDAASGARWRQSLPEPPKYLTGLAAAADRDAVLLRNLLDRREGSTSEALSRPADW